MFIHDEENSHLAPNSYDRLCELLSDAGGNVRSYSGRGMYGRSCLGAVFPDLQEVFSLFYELGVEDGEESVFNEVASAARVDNMGTSLVLYFPNVPVVESANDNDGEDDAA